MPEHSHSASQKEKRKLQGIYCGKSLVDPSTTITTQKNAQNVLSCEKCTTVLKL